MGEKTYRIGEAADMLHLKGYVLRFWETEFPQLTPRRTDKGQRVYTDTHLAMLQRIKYLLHDRGMTIDGARRILEVEQRQGFPVSEEIAMVDRLSTDVVHALRDELLALRHLLQTR